MAGKISRNSCRVCLQNVDCEISLFSICDVDAQFYSDMLNICCDIKVHEGDGLPAKLCGKCACNLPVAYDFITKCKQSNEYLMSLSMLGEFFDSIDAEDELETSQYLPEVEVKCDSLKGENSDTSCCKKIGEPRKYKKRLKRSSRPLECPDCSVTTANRSAMIVHRRKHTREKPYQCSRCEKSFTSKGLLKRHCETFHCNRERKFVCEVCGKGFYRKSDILVHIRRHTGELPHTCSVCSRRFLQISTLIRHTRTHTGAKPFPCSVCGKCFADRSMVKKHMLVHSDERKHVCSLCGKSLKSRDALKNHTAAHTNETLNVCDHCGVAFSSKGYLIKHIANVHSSRSGFCPKCNKQYSDLQTHSRKHTGEKPFRCDQCDGDFMTKRSLLHHANYKHDNIDKYKCSAVGCGKTFPVKYYYEVHKLKYHSNEKPFVCQFCNRGFCRISDLSRHLKLSHGNEYNNK